MTKKHNTRLLFAYQQGFSLVELMVSMLIGLLLMAGVIQIFSGSKQTYRMEEELSRLQENARYAIDELSTDFRMSGHQGCADPASAKANILANGMVAQMVTGTEHASAGGADTVTIQYAGSAGIPLSETMSTESSHLKALLSLTANFNANSIVTIADCESIDVFRVTAVSDDGTIKTFEHDQTADNTGNSTNKLTKVFTTDARLLSFNTITYTIADTGRNNRRGDSIFALFKNGVEIVEGVENIQVLYGERLGTTSTANIRYVPAGTAGLDMSRVISIQVGLLLSTIESARDTDDTSTYSILGENIASGTAIAAGTYDKTDHRIRRVFTTTVKIRNRR